jgi:hypothetical protein
MDVGIIELSMISVGMVFAYLSTPSRFSINVRDDNRIVWLFGVGVLTRLIGLSFFVTAINQTAVTIAPKARRDINLGISSGITF